MVQVILSSGPARAAVGGQGTVEVEAGNLRELLDRLAATYPALQRQLSAGVSIAVNGAIYNDDWFKPFPDNAEIVLLPRITGG